MHRAHRIRLNPTPEQEAYFFRCADVARFTWNWALGQYNEALARRAAIDVNPTGVGNEGAGHAEELIGQSKPHGRGE